MSFGFRDKDKPSLSGRFENLRGKSGDQILEELRKKLDQDKKMFFETVPKPPSFRRAGFPFDDEGLRGRHDFRHRLEELAQQHPEFADSLRPWYSETQQAESAQPSNPAGCSPRQGPSNAPADPQPAPEPEQQQPEQARGIQHHGLRNTVDIGQARQAQQQMDAQDDRVKRAQSAPPDNPPKEPQRFVSRLEINPAPGASATATNQDPAAAKPPVAPKHPQQPPQQTKQAGNVRHIPIFVEGRDEPVMPKHDVDSAASFNFFRPAMGGMHESSRLGDSPRFTSSAHHQFRPQEAHHPEPQAHKRPFPQQQSQPRPPPQSQPQAPPQAPQAPQAPPQAQQTPPPPPKQPTKPKDSLEKVSEVRKEVEELEKQVDAFVGRKQDKNYLYLDEMLTRNLIKLDLVETEGREDVRAARREAIRAIQKCISTLEYKAMTPEEREARAKAEEAMEVESSESQPMDTEPSEPAQPASAEATKTEGVASSAEANPDSKSQVSTESKPTEGQPGIVQESAVSSSTSAGNAEAAERITSTGSPAEAASPAAAAAPSEGASVTSTESVECGSTPDSTQVPNVAEVKAS